MQMSAAQCKSEQSGATHSRAKRQWQQAIGGVFSTEGTAAQSVSQRGNAAQCTAWQCSAAQCRAKRQGHQAFGGVFSTEGTAEQRSAGQGSAGQGRAKRQGQPVLAGVFSTEGKAWQRVSLHCSATNRMALNCMAPQDNGSQSKADRASSLVRCVQHQDHHQSW